MTTKEEYLLIAKLALLACCALLIFPFLTSIFFVMTLLELYYPKTQTIIDPEVKHTGLVICMYIWGIASLLLYVFSFILIRKASGYLKKIKNCTWEK